MNEYCDFHSLDIELEGNGMETSSWQDGGRCGIFGGRTLCTNVYHPSATARTRWGSGRSGFLVIIRPCANAYSPEAVGHYVNGPKYDVGYWCYYRAAPTKVQPNTSHPATWIERNRAGHEMRAMGWGTGGRGDGWTQVSALCVNCQLHVQAVGTSKTESDIYNGTRRHPPPHTPQHCDVTCIESVAADGNGYSTMLLHSPSPPTWGPSPATVPLHQPSSTRCVQCTTDGRTPMRGAAKRSLLARSTNDGRGRGNGSGNDDVKGCGFCDWTGGRDGGGIGGNYVCNYLCLSPRADHRLHHQGRRRGLLGAILTYILWVFSAFVTYLGDNSAGAEQRRRKAIRREKRMRKTPTKPMDLRATTRGPRRLVAIAPPIVGRARLRRRRIGRGTWRAIRICRTPRPRVVGKRGMSSALAARQPPRGQALPIRTTALPLCEGSDDIGRRCGDGDGLTAAEACCGGLGTLRVGEATNPGHAPQLGWVASKLASVISYARPGKKGFHGTHTVGCGGVDDGPPSEPFALRISTANTTGWRPLQRYLLETDAHVIFAQEHRLLPDSIPAASAWARAQGWKTVWAPAKLGKGGGAAAGTVILARDFVGLRHPDRGNAVVAESRVVAAVIEPPSCRPFMGYAAYLHDGQGLSRTNLDLVASIGAHWESQEDSTLQLIVGADFNMEPATFARAGLAKKVWGRLVVPPTPRGTCRTRTRSATYDYFFMSAALAELVASVESVEGTGIKTHAPTAATFHPRLAALKALRIRAAPSFPLEEVYGPRPQPPPWQCLRLAAEQLVALARDGGDFVKAEGLLSDIYALWLDTVEEELAGITGVPVPKRSHRSSGPRFVWHSILPEASKAPPPSGASALAWLADIARDATKIARPPVNDDALPNDVVIDVLMRALDDAIIGKDPLVDDGSVDKLRSMLQEARCLDGRCTDRDDDQWTSWAANLDDFVTGMRDRHAKCVAEETNDKIRGWKAWLREGFDAGAKHAHAYLRLPVEWRPTVATTSDGLLSAEPARILSCQRDKYAKAWAADGESGWYQPPDRAALPRLTPSDLREASRLFKKSTATAYDGIHCRHYAMLGDEALEVLGVIMEICETLVTWPSQARLVVTPLLEKPKGGFRPIAKYVSLYRLWAKARRSVATSWEAAHQRSFFSAAKGNGPQDTTWRQGVRQEARVCQGGASACLFWDLESFFECVDREVLLRRAQASGFPLPVLRLSLAMYAAPRVLSMGGRISAEVWPKRGVGAGCGLANTYVKIFTLLPLDELIPRLPPSVRLDLHVDDFAIESVASDEGTAARDIIVAHGLIKDMIEKQLGAVVSIPKAALVASSPSLAARIRDAVGTLAGPVRVAAANLGVDATAARRRGVRGAGPIRRARWGQAFKRRHRLRSLAAVVGAKAGKVFTVGIGASATYHAAVQGLSDAEVAKLRRLAAVAYPPRSRFRSLTLAHLLYDMPTAAAEVAATLQYSRAVWSATLLGGDRPRHEGFDLPGIRAAWDQVAQNINEFLDVSNPDPRKRRRWSRTRGPLSAAMLELHRAGWTPRGPFDWVDDQGVEVQLTCTPPAMMKLMLTSSVRRQAERAMGAKRAACDPAYAGRRICVDAAADALKRCRDLTPMQKGAFRAVLLGGVLTRSKAAAMGYDVDDVCELCGEAGDSVFHRTYKCRGTEHLVRNVVPQWFWDEAQVADVNDQFWINATMPHPADLVPPPPGPTTSRGSSTPMATEETIHAWRGTSS